MFLMFEIKKTKILKLEIYFKNLSFDILIIYVTILLLH